MSFPFDVASDRPPAFGLIVLETDELVELELDRCFLDAGFRIYHTRIPSAPEVSPETLAAMSGEMTHAARQLPSGTGIAAIGYGCTSGATVIGETRVAELIGAAHPGIPTSDPMTALINACAALEIRKLGLVTPYVAEVSEALIARLAERDISVGPFASFEQEEEAVVARIDPQSTLAAVIEVGKGDCDAVFASCTNLRAWEIVADAETALGKPVLCSNQVMAWHLLRLAGLEPPPTAAGAIFAQG